MPASQDMLPPRSRYPTTGRLRRVLLRIAYSNAWIALHGAGYVLVALLLLHGKLVWMPLLAGFAGIQLVYTFAKVVLIEPEADAINDPERTAFILRWRKPLIAATVALWLAVVLASTLHSWWAALLLPMPVVVAMFYELRLLPRWFERRRLKDFTGVKSLVVGLTFGTFCGWLVAAWTDAAVNSASTWIVVGWISARMFVNTVFFDIGDVVGDMAEGTRTVPIAIGLTRTKWLLHAVNVISAMALGVATYLEQLPVFAHVVAWPAMAFAIGYVVKARHIESDIGFTCDVIADGDGIFVGALALVGWLLL